MAKKRSKRDAKNDPRTEEFARRIVDKYLNVTPELRKKLRPFKKIGLEDKDSEMDTEVRNILSDHVADRFAMDNILNIDRVYMNTSYFNFIVNSVRHIMGDEVDVVEEEDIPPEKVRKKKRQPKRDKVWHTQEGKEYKRTKGRKWTFRELMFIKTALGIDRERKEILDDFNSTDIFKARTKSSIYTMIQRIKSGKKQV